MSGELLLERLDLGSLRKHAAAQHPGHRLDLFVADQRLPWAQADLADVDPHLRDAARWFTGWTERQRDRLGATGGDVLGALGDLQQRNVALMASAATHALLPRLATREAAAMQLDAGLRSHRRRFGEPAGLWLPECAWAPGIDGLRLALQGLPPGQRVERVGELIP